jgi:hypothetical protein
MKEISIPLKYLDIDAFLDRTIDYRSSEVTSEVDPTYAVVWIDRAGDIPGSRPGSGGELNTARKKGARWSSSCSSTPSN